MNEQDLAKKETTVGPTAEELKDVMVDAIKEANNQRVLTRSNTITVSLPSNGLMNKNITEITMRKMSTLEMKTLHTSSDPNFLDKLLLGCIVSPNKITLEDLHPNDIIYLLFVLRYISSPKDLTQMIICPNCKKDSVVSIKINELNVKYAKDPDNEFLVKLEECEDTITFRLLSEGEILDKDKIMSRKARQEDLSPDEEAWNSLLSRTANWLVYKNDKEFTDFKEKTDYLLSLSAYDFETLRLAYAKEVASFGLERNYITTCSKCKEDVEVEAYIAPDFFRLV